MVIIDVGRFGAFVLDLDGVITRTASIHARAWKQLFDQFLAQRAAQSATPFLPFDPETDYHRYVDGKPRIAGLQSFLASRGINVRLGEPGDQPEQETAHGLAKRKDLYFLKLLAVVGVQVFDSAPAFLRDARGRGVRTAIASSSHHCAEILHAARLTALFDARVDGIDLDRLSLTGKPAPDMFLESRTPSQRTSSACCGVRGCDGWRRSGSRRQFRPCHRRRACGARARPAQAWGGRRCCQPRRSPAGGHGPFALKPRGRNGTLQSQSSLSSI